MRPMGGLGRHIVGLIPNYLPEIWQHLQKAHFDWGAKMAPAADPGWGSLARAVEAVDGVARRYCQPMYCSPGPGDEFTG